MDADTIQKALESGRRKDRAYEEALRRKVLVNCKITRFEQTVMFHADGVLSDEDFAEYIRKYDEWRSKKEVSDGDL